MSRQKYRSDIESEARILILVSRFTTPKNSLEGRTKLAKLDFFLRYPEYLDRAVRIRGGDGISVRKHEINNIENRMVRYKYGPWDPAYYAILGALIGRKMIKPVRMKKGIGYRATELGGDRVKALTEDQLWKQVDERSRVLKRHLNLTGTFLKKFIYKEFPEVTNASWGEEI